MIDLPHKSLGGFLFGVAWAVIVFCFAFALGDHYARAKLPSCLYLNRPRSNDVKPWGCNGKEGMDWHCDQIGGGGIYVDLSPWKCGR